VIKSYNEKFGYLICPHTACGVSAVDQLRDELQWQTRANHEMVVLGTAHPAKFSHAVEAACGKVPEMPPTLKAAQSGKMFYKVAQNSEHCVRAILQNSVQCVESVGA